MVASDLVRLFVALWAVLFTIAGKIAGVLDDPNWVWSTLVLGTYLVAVPIIFRQVHEGEKAAREERVIFYYWKKAIANQIVVASTVIGTAIAYGSATSGSRGAAVIVGILFGDLVGMVISWIMLWIWGQAGVLSFFAAMAPDPRGQNRAR